MSLRRTSICVLALLAWLAAGASPIPASGPLLVTGPDANQPGTPCRWTLSPITYKTDLGLLGNQTNAQANTLVAEAFDTWHNVSTANISFTQNGQLSQDITAANIVAFQNAIYDCNDATQPTNAIIYDVDGSAIQEFGMDKNSVMGFAGATCIDPFAGTYERGWAVLNGWFIDGSSAPPGTEGHHQVSIAQFKAVFIHEFGHLVGLDHTQINLNCLTDDTCPAADLEGVPTMFPVMVTLQQATPKTDDKTSLSALYPAGTFDSSTGRIQGHVVFADGVTPAQGYNVIARKVGPGGGDPRRIAVSYVSGYLYTAAAGNPLPPPGEDTESPYGSHDQSLIGTYDIRGLPAGDYTIEVEAINNSGDFAFVGGSSLGPIGSFLEFQYKMPGTCKPQYLNYPSSPTDSCSAQTTVTVGPGSVVDTHTDVILLGTPPRYDAWEDGGAL
jgi:hypothetical protein